MTIPDSIKISSEPDALSAQLRELSGVSGIYLLVASGKPHLSWSANLGRRLKRVLASLYVASNGAKGTLADRLSAIECWTTGSRLETSIVMAALARRHFPGDYLRRLRLRLPWFISVTPDASLARLVLVNRLPKREPAYGPFRTRDAAQLYQEELLSLFQIRRCRETLHPHPNHPGCIYGEMNLCMRPCQAAVTESEYAREAERVRSFLQNNGRTTLGSLTAARDRACEVTDFEQASQLHKRLDRVKAVVALRDDAIAEAHQFHGVALTPGRQDRTLRLWPIVEGYWQTPIELNFATGEANQTSLDRELRDRLSQALLTRTCSGRRIEALALFSRWYYSSWRDGHWFAFRTLDDLNYRRLVRAISSMLKPSSTPA